jgi:Uma2 family endonuclease
MTLSTGLQFKKPIDISHLVIEDGKPLDNIYSSHQQHLWMQVLHDSDALPEPFLVVSNVGLFYDPDQDPIVPDTMLSLGVKNGEDYSQKKNRSYFVWEIGKFPEVCIEIVSNKEGDEVNLSRKSIRKNKTVSKKERYAQLGIKYYIVYDPLQQLQSEMGDAKAKLWVLSPDGDYPEELSQSIHQIGDRLWMEEIGLGMTLWFGEYARQNQDWLRWCDAEGNIYLTGAEQARLADRKAALERIRAEEEKLRAESADRRAKQEKLRAEQEKLRAESAETKAKRLADRLRELGLNPDDL